MFYAVHPSMSMSVSTSAISSSFAAASSLERRAWPALSLRSVTSSASVRNSSMASGKRSKSQWRARSRRSPSAASRTPARVAAAASSSSPSSAAAAASASARTAPSMKPPATAALSVGSWCVTRYCVSRSERRWRRALSEAAKPCLSRSRPPPARRASEPGTLSRAIALMAKRALARTAEGCSGAMSPKSVGIAPASRKTPCIFGLF
mmetsp:Transcript_6346/g.21251  ORF Transcript_6346/g.21251 Transcript_6346/m.21251 type:complete len:207 (+) Transcript_6346:927-1547(+)